MTGAARPRAEVGPAQALREGYEVLRKQALEGRAGGLGLALLLREGMAAWIHAGERAIPAPVPPRPARPDPGLPDGVHGEIVTVLAGMALTTYREAAA